jgi:hypothetical protein
MFDPWFQNREYVMRTWVGCSAIARFAGVMTAAWLCGMATASAGDGGDDTAIQPALNTICTYVGMTSCPHVPTITQAILEMSGLANAAPDFVRGPQGPLVADGLSALCTVSSGAPGGLNVCSQGNAINAVNPPAASPVAVSDLPNLTPLAFTTGKGVAVPVPLGTSGANSYLYAVATPEQNGEFKTLTLFFDYPVQTNSTIQKGQVFAKISLPLKVLNNDGGERLICGAAPCPSLTSLATLQISGCNSGQGCVNGLLAQVTGDFSAPGTIGTMSASQLNIGVSVSFAPSPNSAGAHLILQVQVPLLVTRLNDPAYFGLPPFVTGSPTLVNQLSGLPTAFTSDVNPAFGVAPEAAPKCSGTCPPTTFASTFPFCASFSGSGSGPLGSGPFHSAVATFFTLGTDATAYVSSPVSLAGSSLQCPF